MLMRDMTFISSVTLPCTYVTRHWLTDSTAPPAKVHRLGLRAKYCCSSPSLVLNGLCSFNDSRWGMASQIASDSGQISGQNWHRSCQLGAACISGWDATTEDFISELDAGPMSVGKVLILLLFVGLGLVCDCEEYTCRFPYHYPAS